MLLVSASGRGRAPTSATSAGPESSSSWARSQTVITRSASSSTSPISFGRAAERSRPGATRRRDGAGVNAFGRVRACALGGLVRELRPQRCCELRARRVVRADEQWSGAASSGWQHQFVERMTVQVHVAASPVAARAAACDEPDMLEHVEVVSEQVGWNIDDLLQLDRRTIGSCELVHDRQAGRVAERGVPLRSRHRCHISRLSLNLV